MSLRDEENDTAVMLDPMERNFPTKYLDHRLRINKEIKRASYLEGSHAECPYISRNGNISTLVFPFAGNSN
jgi:hypothetical protein